VVGVISTSNHLPSHDLRETYPVRGFRSFDAGAGNADL
jgi:hypothetical protein